MNHNLRVILRLPKVVTRMAQTFTPGGGLGLMVSPPEGSRNAGQDQIFNFNGDRVPNTSSIIILIEESKKEAEETMQMWN
jgi:hypothetical protein